MIALLVLATSGRPVLYRGERVGRGGHFFAMLKFRTLRAGAEERIGQYLGEELVRRTDAELTGFGRWLKASQLDEIPQLWNVLRGDMSFVGPRPIRPRFFSELAHDLPAYWQRLVVRPGLTGFAQVRRGYETSMAEKLAHDLEWIADRSVRLYLRTLVSTAFRVVRQTVSAPTVDSAAMCGICGIASTRGAVDPDRLRARWPRRSYHRGPDSEGAHVDGAVGLAARRLAIIDLTGGDQPIANEDGTVVVVQNGEIYNYRELTQRARARRAPLPHALRHRGARARLRGVGRRPRERLRGMFAVALWDAPRAAARARTRPLRHQAALLPRRRRRAVVRVRARRAAAAARSTSTPSRRSSRSTSSPRRSRSSATSASCRPVTCSRGATAQRRLERFARPGPLPARHGEDEAELVEECRARLRDSVRAHLVADVPVGVLLSGGVDSGALAALAAEESPEPVRTFSIGFEEASFDELAGARAVARALRHACTASSCYGRTRHCSCPRSRRRSTSRSRTRRRSRPTSSRSSRPRT